MQKIGLSLVLTIALFILTTGAAMAITFGEPDSDHPHVGLVGFFDEDGNWMWRCSGTLISEELLLTAGHCTSADYPDNPDYAPAEAMVWFGDKIELDPILDDYPDLECYQDDPDGRTWTTYPCEGGVPGIPIANPEFTGLYIPETHDIGVVVLTGEIPSAAGSKFGHIPTIGFLDELADEQGARAVVFNSVGYGLNQIKPDEISLRERYISTSFLINLENALTDGFNIMTSNNPGRWPEDGMAYSGGTCYGDSGGPLFYTAKNGREYLVGITSFGLNPNCKGTDFSYRIDTEDAHEFLEPFYP
jgi:hypothetical protein